MKRIAAVLLLWVVVFGGLHLYLKRFEAMRPAAASPPRQVESSGSYALEITTTFSVEPDPFALQTDSSGKPAALLIRIGQQEVSTEIPEVDAGIPVRIAPVQGIIPGMNELFVEAVMPLEMSGKSLALRLRLLRDEVPVAEKTFWSEGGNRIAGTFRVKLSEEKNKESHHE
ncbi:MAG: hypothetical protein AB9866_02160 [Syntrophobacteraceae bacterium]